MYDIAFIQYRRRYMDRPMGEIVLLTGSSGFLGRHVVKFLLEDEDVTEIRALDKVPPCNDNEEALDNKNDEKIVKFYNCDLVNLESCRDAFRDVDIVMHCAGLVCYDYPANAKELEKNNVKATENVVKLCLEENVGVLIHCSTTEVTLQSYIKGGIVAINIYKQESKLNYPDNDKRLLFGEYAATKLKAEKYVLKSNGAMLNNGKGTLRTVALRPTYLYGDGDNHLIPKILKLGKSRGDCLPRLSGAGGKQQITYVGNAAWAFLRAKETLLKNPESIAGLPVTVTDDTPIEDLMRFCERTTRTSPDRHLRISSWSVPLVISYLGALILEFLSDCGIIDKFEVSPRSIVAYLGSIILYNRARASIHMNYWPKYSHDRALAIASKYYGGLYSDK